MLHPILVSDVYVQGELQESLANIAGIRLPIALHQQVNRRLDLAIGDQTHEQVTQAIWWALKRP